MLAINIQIWKSVQAKSSCCRSFYFFCFHEKWQDCPQLHCLPKNKWAHSIRVQTRHQRWRQDPVVFLIHIQFPWIGKETYGWYLCYPPPRTRNKFRIGFSPSTPHWPQRLTQLPCWKCRTHRNTFGVIQLEHS